MSWENKKKNSKQKESEKELVYFDKLVCIICNQKIQKSELQHNCSSRDKNLYLHILPNSK